MAVTQVTASVALAKIGHVCSTDTGATTVSNSLIKRRPTIDGSHATKSLKGFVTPSQVASLPLAGDPDC